MRGKVGNSQHFPTNLHILLDEADKAGHGHIVSWCSQGQSFKIHDQEAIVPLLAKYFRQTKFKSFLRQLQSYGFNRTTRGVDKGVVSHPYFVRGRRSLCFRMTRKPTGSTAQMALTRQIGNNSLPADAIIPLRKIQSAPVGFHSRMQNGGIKDVSQFKNATFNLGQATPMGEIGHNFLQKMNGFRADHVPSALKLTRERSQSTACLSSAVPTMNSNKAGQIRRVSDSSVRLSSAQMRSIQECAEIDYRTAQPEPRAPRNNFLLSIQESTSVPLQVPSSQPQQPMQLQALKQQEHQSPLYQQVIQVQQTPGPQNTNQVHIQQMHSYNHHAQGSQFSVQYSTQPDQKHYPQQVSYTHYNVKPPQPQEVNDKLYSQQEVAEKIQQAKADMEKHFHEQMKQQNGKPAHSLPSFHPALNQPLVHEEKKCASPVTSSLPPPQKTAAMFASAPSNNFELSFSTSEFSDGNKGASASYNAATFSISPLGGETTNPIGIGMMKPLTPRAAMNAYKKNTVELRPIEIHNMESNHHSSSHEANHQPIEPDNHCDSIDQGTVDFLLQSGHEDWDVPADEVANGLDWDPAPVEVESSCGHPPVDSIHHHSNPIPIYNQYDRRQ